MKQFTFDAEIKASEIGKAGAYIVFPYDAKKEFKENGRIKVISYFDGVEYNGTLVKAGLTKYIIGVSKEIRNKIGKDHGDIVSVQLHNIPQKPVDLHPLLKKKIDMDKTLKARYEQLGHVRKKDILNLLTGAKKPETVNNRLEKIITELNCFEKESVQP